MKASELTGPALDWAVAKCEGVNEEAFHLYYEPTDPTDYDRHGYPEFHYSTIWSQGGPIIEREGIAVRMSFDDEHKGWTAIIWAHKTTFFEDGPTPLIAAMRCYVASKLGEDIDIPEELR